MWNDCGEEGVLDAQVADIEPYLYEPLAASNKDSDVMSDGTDDECMAVTEADLSEW
mgnify:FL=1